MPPLGLPRLSSEPVLFLPLWLGTLRDHSGNGNHGTNSGGYWNQLGSSDGIRFNSTNRIDVADAAELRLTEGTFFFAGLFDGANLNRRLAFKQSGATGYDVYLSSTKITLYDGTYIRYAVINWEGAASVAVSFKSGEKFSGYTDGVFVSLANNINLISASTTSVQICNRMAVAGAQFQGAMRMVAFYPTKLSAPEIAELHAYSQARITPRKQWPGGGLRYPDRGTPYTPATGDPMFLDNISTARVTLADEAGPSTQLSNLGIEIVTGTWAITEDSTGRQITCVANGQLRKRLLDADTFTTALFTETGGVTLTKNSTNFTLDATAGDTVSALQLTAP